MIQDGLDVCRSISVEGFSLPRKSLSGTELFPLTYDYRFTGFFVDGVIRRSRRRPKREDQIGWTYLLSERVEGHNTKMKRGPPTGRKNHRTRRRTLVSNSVGYQDPTTLGPGHEIRVWIDLLTLSTLSPHTTQTLDLESCELPVSFLSPTFPFVLFDSIGTSV